MTSPPVVTADFLVGRGIRGVVVDLDNTLVPWNTTLVFSEIAAWVAQLKQAGLRLCILSNASHRNRVERVARKLDIPYVSLATKPRRRSFRVAADVMKVSVKQLAVIGDQIFTDVLGGNRLGVLTVLVTPASPRDFIGTKLMRLMEKVVTRLLRLRHMLPETPLETLGA